MTPELLPEIQQVPGVNAPKPKPAKVEEESDSDRRWKEWHEDLRQDWSAT